MSHSNYLRTILFCAISAVCSLSHAQSGMALLSDSELAAEDGQALFNLSYLAPNDAGNDLTNSTTQGNVGFYKLGIEGTVAMNANIRKLQLGCGGANGGGGCDIDIDYLSLSGDPGALTGPVDSKGNKTPSLDDSARRAQSDATLTNPFMQLAIKNPSSASTRQVVGIQLGASSIMGMLTFGKENSGTANGINSLSGYLQVAPTVGTALVNGFGTSTNGDPARPSLKQSDGYDAIKGNACCLFAGLGNLSFTTTSYDLNLRDKATGSNILRGDLVMGQQVITGSRMSSATLKATAIVRDIDLSGRLVAVAAGIINLDKAAAGTIQNLTIDTTINEQLGFFHKANLNGTAAGLSLQGQDIKYPGSVSVAKKGWWLELSNPIDIGRIDPTENVDIPKATLNESFAQVSAYLQQHPVFCGNFFAINCLTGGTIDVGTVDLEKSAKIPLTLTNLQLVNQSFAPNCYGGLKFC